MRILLLISLAAAAQESPDYTYYLTGSSADAQVATRPGFVLAGGGRDQPEAWRWFLDRGGHGDAVVLRASGADGYHGFIQQLGEKVDSVESIVFKNRRASSAPFVIERIDRADALFFAGGNQANYVRYWKDTPVADAIHRAIQRGIPVGGTSAGLAILGEFGFSAENGTVTSEQAKAGPDGARIALSSGFLRLPHLGCLITDSHFSERKREGRLEVFLARIQRDYPKCPAARGLGIDERTAVLMDSTGQATVVGQGAAHYWTTAGKRAYTAGQTFSLRVD